MSRETGLKCIAQLMTIIRPEWDFNGCLAILRKVDTTKTIPQVARAALWFAEHRTTQKTPAMLIEDGTHWHLDNNEQRGPYLPKPKILTEPMPEPLPPERIQEFRQQMKEKLQ